MYKYDTLNLLSSVNDMLCKTQNLCFCCPENVFSWHYCLNGIHQRLKGAIYYDGNAADYNSEKEWRNTT